MGIGVNGYSSDSIADKVYSKYSNTAVNTNMTGDESSSYLDFDGYLKLLTSQMSNQDFNNSMSDSEFIQQMASYSMMEAISQLTKQTALTYTSSLIGKAVTVSDGTSSPDTGIVEAVTVTSDGCKILVNGNQYSADSITDVVDGEVFNMLNTFAGQTVEVKDGDGTVTGKVMGVFIKNGNGFVTLDNKQIYGIEAITQIITPEDDSKDNEGESTENTEGAADSESTAQVSENAAANSYSAADETTGVTARSQDAFDTLMKMLDGDMDNLEEELLERYARTAVSASLDENYDSASVEMFDAASGLVSDSRIPEPSVYNQYYSASKSANNTTGNVSAAAAKASYDSGEEAGVTTVSDIDAQAQNLTLYAEKSGYTSVPSSTRKYAEDYPLEAAFADSTGTHMGDIRFIGNTDIMDRVDTSEIICYSQKGHAVTDIGWCGKGRLGEVVTFADGRQRVEVIGNKGVSYLFTSGNYTLNEMFSNNVPYGYFVGKLTPEEIAIRHYAEEYSPAEEAEMKNFEQYCVWHAATNGLS